MSQTVIIKHTTKLYSVYHCLLTSLDSLIGWLFFFWCMCTCIDGTKVSLACYLVNSHTRITLISQCVMCICCGACHRVVRALDSLIYPGTLRDDRTCSPCCITNFTCNVRASKWHQSSLNTSVQCYVSSNH